MINIVQPQVLLASAGLSEAWFPLDAQTGTPARYVFHLAALLAPIVTGAN